MVGEMRRVGMAFERVEGVEGRALHCDDPSLVAPSLLTRPSFRPGTAACALSHLAVYRRVLDAGADVALVLEDDVLLPDDFKPLVNDIAAALSGAAVALLNFHAPRPARLRHDRALALPSGRQMLYPQDLAEVSSGAAYLITRQACAGLLSVNLPVASYADEWHVFNDLGAVDCVRCVSPMPVENSPMFRTTIDYFRAGSWQSRARDRLGALRLPFVDKVLAAKRRRVFRKRGWTGGELLVGDETSPAEGHPVR